MFRQVGVMVLAGACLLIAACEPRMKLVEQFDNGPAGGPPGSSEGYFRVKESAHPTPGKHWKPVDGSTLTREQQARIRSWP